VKRLSITKPREARGARSQPGGAAALKNILVSTEFSGVAGKTLKYAAVPAEEFDAPSVLEHERGWPKQRVSVGQRLRGGSRGRHSGPISSQRIEAGMQTVRIEAGDCDERGDNESGVIF